MCPAHNGKINLKPLWACSDLKVVQPGAELDVPSGPPVGQAWWHLGAFVFFCFLRLPASFCCFFSWSVKIGSLADDYLMTHF